MPEATSSSVPTRDTAASEPPFTAINPTTGVSLDPEGTSSTAVITVVQVWSDLPTATPSLSVNSTNNLDPGATAGISIGAVIVLAAITLLILRRSRKYTKMKRRETNRTIASLAPITAELDKELPPLPTIAWELDGREVPGELQASLKRPIELEAKTSWMTMSTWASEHGVGSGTDVGDGGDCTLEQLGLKT